MRDKKPSSRRRYLLLRASIVVLGLLALYYIELTTVQREYFLQRPGEIDRVVEVHTEERDDWLVQDILLTSTTGLDVSVRVLRPRLADQQPLPVILLAGGLRTGRSAVDLVTDNGNIAFAAIDYPHSGTGRIRGLWSSLRAVPAFQRGLLDTPPALLLALDWLAGQAWVDHARMELVGVSLGVPFVAVAGALDDRVHRVWLVQGARDNVAWIETALPRRIDGKFKRRQIARAVSLVGYSASLDTEQWVAEIAPRKIVVISSRNDEFVPFTAALGHMKPQENLEIIWTDSRHVRATRHDVLDELLQIVRSRVEFPQ
ncbi:MAG: hypothetical protein KJO31_15465 [Gammaproteobacteria bacterium]|nr:hypothetical protein [Gammaproteobacteria bacterium]